MQSSPNEQGFPLPTVIDPETTVCYQINVPNDPAHISAFLGVLYDLTLWVSWQRDSAHTGVQAAQVWKQIWAALVAGCDTMTFDVRQESGLPCILQKNSGSGWTDFANLQLCPPKIRTSNGIIEWFDGSDWVTLPGGGDERQDGTYTPAWPSGSVPSGQTAQCLTAENIVSTYASALEQTRVGLVAGEAATVLAATIVGIASLFIPGAIFGVIALAIGGLLFEGGETALNDAVSDPNLTILRCAIDLNCSADGSITSVQYNAIYAYVGAHATGTTKTIMQSWLDGYGPVGLSRQGKAAGITSADCSDCVATWDYPSNFLLSDGGYQEGDSSYPPATSQYVSGTGWTGRLVVFETFIKIQFAIATHVTLASITFALDGADGACNASYQDMSFTKISAGPTYTTLTHDPCDISTPGRTYSATLSADFAAGDWFQIGGYNAGSSYIHLTAADLQGDGDYPF